MIEQSSNPQRIVPTRRISFEETLEDLPKHFAKDGDLLRSHLTATLSALFPDGEDFFVRSVRHYRKQIADPALKQQVNGFIGQEAMHGREHRAFNARLAELGYPTKKIEAMVRWGLGARSKYAPAAANLALTAALEHFTATLAEALLANPDLAEELGEAGVRDLFLWHALEESEHKAVAFDVYKAVGAPEWIRVWTMKILRPGFVAFTAIHVLVSALMDPAGRKRGAIRKSWRSIKHSKLLSRDIWEQLKEYDRPDFHPNDRDTTALEAEWRERLFGADGELNDLLTAAPAA
ncbi:MAG: metal-dependent hydrolase [Acidimicrobiales bacterium]